MLKSPVRNVGIPLAASGGSAASWSWIAGSRTAVSRARTSDRDAPSRISYGPYGSAGRWTLPIATNRPGRTSTQTYVPLPPGGSTIGKREITCSPIARVPAERRRDHARVVLALLDADDVGARCLDDMLDLGERLGTAGRSMAPRARMEVELIATVEDVQAHDADDRGGLDGRRGGRHRGLTGQGDDARDDERDAGPVSTHRGLPRRSDLSRLEAPQGQAPDNDRPAVVSTRRVPTRATAHAKERRP